jgi:hypothetical protein
VTSVIVASGSAARLSGLHTNSGCCCDLLCDTSDAIKVINGHRLELVHPSTLISRETQLLSIISIIIFSCSWW